MDEQLWSCFPVLLNIAREGLMAETQTAAFKLEPREIKEGPIKKMGPEWRKIEDEDGEHRHDTAKTSKT